MNIVQQLEAEHAAELSAARPVPEFAPGDTVRVNVRVTEGTRERVQAYEGVCISRSGGGLNESFTVRKISYGEGVERIFPVHSPMIDSIDVLRRGVVRRAKLYYLRGRRGKSARIAERKDPRTPKKVKAAASANDGPMFTAPKGQADDLKLIKGVGPELESRLKALGIATFSQIAEFSDDDIARVDDVLSFKGRIEREDWVSQARDLMADSTAGEAVKVAEEEAAAEKAAEAEKSE